MDIKVLRERLAKRLLREASTLDAIALETACPDQQSFAIQSHADALREIAALVRSAR